VDDFAYVVTKLVLEGLTRGTDYVGNLAIPTFVQGQLLILNNIINATN